MLTKTNQFQACYLSYSENFHPNIALISEYILEDLNLSKCIQKLLKYLDKFKIYRIGYIAYIYTTNKTMYN